MTCYASNFQQKIQKTSTVLFDDIQTNDNLYEYFRSPTNDCFSKIIKPNTVGVWLRNPKAVYINLKRLHCYDGLYLFTPNNHHK